MALTKKQKAHALIHSVSGTAAAIGGGMAQVPLSDALLLIPLQASMVVAIALIHGRRVQEATATTILGTLGATMFGRAISQLLVGWIPVFGNTVNAGTAAAITETVGWAAYKFFERLGDEPLSDDEVAERAKKWKGDGKPPPGP